MWLFTFQKRAGRPHGKRVLAIKDLRWAHDLGDVATTTDLDEDELPAPLRGQVQDEERIS
jgi:hypothetical protein